MQNEKTVKIDISVSEYDQKSYRSTVTANRTVTCKGDFKYSEIPNAIKSEVDAIMKGLKTDLDRLIKRDKLQDEIDRLEAEKLQVEEVG